MGELFKLINDTFSTFIRFSCQPPTDEFVGLSWTIKSLTLRLLTEPCRPRLASCRQSAKWSRSGGRTLCNVDRYIPTHVKHNSVIADSVVCLTCTCWRKPIPPALQQVLPYGLTSPRNYLSGKITYINSVMFAKILTKDFFLQIFFCSFRKKNRIFAMWELKVVSNQTTGVIILYDTCIFLCYTW